jgi:hypothetical protein
MVCPTRRDRRDRSVAGADSVVARHGRAPRLGGERLPALSDFAGYRELMTPAVLKADVLEREDATARLHLVWHHPFPLRNRDTIVRYRVEKLPDEGWRLT